MAAREGGSTLEVGLMGTRQRTLTLIAALCSSCAAGCDGKAKAEAEESSGVVTRWKCVEETDSRLERLLSGTIPEAFGLIIETRGEHIRGKLVDLESAEGFVVSLEGREGFYQPEENRLVFPVEPLPPGERLESWIRSGGVCIAVDIDLEAESLETYSINARTLTVNGDEIDLYQHRYDRYED